MASGTAGSTSSSARAADRAASYDGFIEKQLNKTRTRVKLVDLAGSLLALAIGVLAYLLAVAIIDHWLLGLGSIGRMIALAGLAGGVGYFCIAQLFPLLVYKINPAYAARVIERSEPSLKNSLINFLMFRPDRATAPAVVYQALQQKAAADLSHVEIENVIDRTKAIRMGYVLVGVFAVCAIYSAASPKSTWQTMRRVAFPLSDIARPSRVSIDEVAPGDADVFLGDSAAISAAVRGIGDDDQVRLVYSTADGQIVDREAAMRPADGGARFEIQLPEESSGFAAAASHSSGLQQDVSYRIVAGDAISPQYRLTVRPAPTMFVERVEYEFPAYTNNSPQVQERQGDIKALEGTRVVIHARANYPIQSASVEFRQGSGGGRAGSAPMTIDGADAQAEFVLQLNPERTSQRYSSYELRFVTADGRANDNPTLYRIDVLRDLDPTVEVLTPKLARIKLPEDGRQSIEVRAVDPDFALRSVALVGSSATGQSLNEELLPQTSDGVGQQLFRYTLEPSKMGLFAGDVFTFWAVAQDNRTSHDNKEPAPNVVQTRKYEIEIIPSAPPDESKAPDQPPQADEANPQQEGGANSRPQVNPEQKPPGEQGKADQQQPQDGDSGQQQEGESSPGGAAGGADGQPGDRQKGRTEQGGAGQSGGQSSDAGDQSADGGMPGAAGEGADKQDGRKQPGDNSGQSKSGERAGDASSAKPKQGDQQGDPSQQDQRQPLHDGEVFERALEHIEQKKQQASADKNQSGGDKGAPQNQQPDGARPESGVPQDGAPQDDVPKDGAQPGGKKPEGAQPEGGKEKNGASQPGQSPSTQKGEQAPSQQNGNQKSDGRQGGQPNQDGQRGAGDAKSPAGAEGGNNAANGDRTQPPQASPGAQQGAAQDDEAGKQGLPTKKAEFGDDDKTTHGAPQNEGQKGDGPSELDENAGAGAQKNGAPGDGATPQKNGAEPNRGEKPEKKDGAQSPRKEPGAGDASDAGAGAASKDTKGSPSSLDLKDPDTGEDITENLDRKKQLQPDSGKPEDADEAKVPSESKRQSDSKGGQAGDKSGGGKQGGGQGANQQGNDSAGSNSSSDDGAGASSEAGEGETSTKAGDQQRSKSATGQAGNEKGNGSTSTTEGEGSQAGGAAGDQPNDAQSERQSDTPGSSAGGGPVRGGNPDSSSSPQAKGGPTGEVADGDKANLDYARNATDLVLEHLKDQQHDPDPELLKSLQMTKEELQQFVERWEQWKRAAASNDNAQDRQLDDALRSLGLRPSQRATRRDAGRGDSLRNLRDDSQGEIPLPGYRDLFRDYKKGAARAGSEN